MGESSALQAEFESQTNGTRMCDLFAYGMAAWTPESDVC